MIDNYGEAAVRQANFENRTKREQNRCEECNRRICHGYDYCVHHGGEPNQ